MKPTDLRGILQYIPRFRDRTFVVAIDGAIVTDENFANILLDVAVLRSLNIRVVLVHGASAQIRVEAERLGIQPTDLDGTGVTDEATLQLALTAANRLTHEILEGLSASDLRAVCTNSVLARPAGILQGVDHLWTGKVERVDSAFLEDLLGQGVVPVLAPLGFDGQGETYRVNSDAVAVALAKALGAAKLIFITTLDGLYTQDQLIRQMLVTDLKTLVETDALAVDLRSKARHAMEACLAGVPRVHIINGAVDDGLLAEVFSNEGIGTLIYANDYEQIRPALKKDVRNLWMLIKGSMSSDELVRRTQTAIERHLGDYYLFEIDRNPVACIAVHGFSHSKTCELACLCVNPSHENQGLGRRMVEFAERKAKERGFETMVALSTQAFTYFQSKAGFREGTPDDLPPARRERYDQSRRKSKVLVKSLKANG